MKVIYTNKEGEEQTIIFNDPNEFFSIIEKLKIDNLDNFKIEGDEVKDLILKYPLSRKEELDLNPDLQFCNYSRIDKDPIYKVIGKNYPDGFICEIKPLESVLKF
jgi:hypothetical protein